MLHDGPPYANGEHPPREPRSTRCSRTSSSAIKTCPGYKAPYVPGWDTHGLPIELKALKKIGRIERHQRPGSKLRKVLPGVSR